MKKHILTIVVSIIAGVFLLAMLGKKFFTSPYKIDVNQQVELMTSPEATFSLFDLAMAIKANDPNILFIDLRTHEQYKQGQLPNAINVPIDSLFNPNYAEYIQGYRHKTKVLYANSPAEAIRASALLAFNGNTGFRVLAAGFNTANSYVVEIPTPAYYHFSDESMRFNYSTLMPNGSNSKQADKSEEVVIETSAPRGGC